MTQSRNIGSAIQAFRRHGGALRTKQALALGIHPATLYKLRDSGKLTELTRGFYRLADAKEHQNPDLAVVAVCAPEAVVCLISALAVHNITTQIPAAVHLAVSRGSYYRLKLEPLPTRVYRFDPKTFAAGVQTLKIGTTHVRVYSADRTIADCFKFRNKLGLDLALEAVRLGRERRKASIRGILHYARLLRVDRVAQPYLQT
ncbi:MAG: type IV toxin-antitoxin system AbiEi family antitoxin domain-containing protein [Steroidobacteraceae bacterium]